jgi:predicted regulator of Ras-like GTPase activity (Roadblock/LC7/MglB family)
MIKQLTALLERLHKELPGFVTAAVVNCDDGLSLSELSVQPELEAGTAAAYLSSIVKSNRKAIKLLANNAVTDDIIVSTGQHHFIIRDLGKLPFFLFVMTDRNEWLGRTKMVMQSFEKELLDIMQESYPANAINAVN